MITTKFNEGQRKTLTALGCDGVIFGHTKSFDIEDCLVEYKPKIEYIPGRINNKKKQMGVLERWLNNPLGQSGVLVVNSYPTDVRAKQVAANIILKAMEQHRASDANRRSKYDSPEWHRLYGGYASNFRDKRVRNPRLLVMSNIVETSTAQKIEKLRDILDKYSDVPTVLCISTKQDPVSFIAERLFFPVKSGIYVGADKMTLKSMLDI